MRLLVSCLVALLFGTAAPDSGAGEQLTTHRLIDVGAAKLYVEVSGQGSPVLFLHGGLMFFDNAFAKQAAFFAAKHTVIGIDQRGHGHSADGPWALSYKMMADDTAAVIRALKLDAVDVVGFSDGADLAMVLARDHPELVRRMVISGGNLRGLLPAELQERQHWPQEKKNAKVAALVAKLPAFFKSDYAAVSPDGVGHWPIMVAKCYWMWSESVVIEAADLQKISAPVLVMAGDHDFTSIEETTEMFRGIPQGQLIIVPGTGHGTFTERPNLVNLAIEEFLDGPERQAQ